SRPHHAHDGIRRAARVDVSPPPAPLRHAAARARVARARASSRERGRGRRDGAGRARPRRGCALRRLGFRVAGWSRTPKTLPDIETFHGEDGLDAFLRRTEILVCLLPATPATQGMLDLKLIRKLERDGAAGAYLINAARGALQV